MIDHLAKVHQELGGLKTPVIHIAGSKGKGTTANLLGKILELSGKKVGVFSSPFMYKVEEMAKINGVPMENMQAYVDRVQSVNADLSEFEYWTLASLLYFSEQDLDYVILECGWGGLNDATNIISDKVLTILGHIELEHTEVLG
ncbi:bifunctional folylpolyglutamate synthase/dihydrofolate synthase, partial [Candidatus Peregrinibacteria bacterium]|nr:bifunctional folylpolyglutamate synthase/dihydrofolate synthase [Candidatus Peregrinibacteria bacterium]